MTDQLEMTEIVDNVPTKYVVHTWQRQRVRVPVRAMRRTCAECGEEFWAWPDDFDWRCARCRVEVAE